MTRTVLPLSQEEDDVFFSDDEFASDDAYAFTASPARPPAAASADSRRRSRSMSLDKRRSLTLERTYWQNGMAELFLVRGAGYLTAQGPTAAFKVPATRAAFSLGGVDFFSLPADSSSREHLACHPASWLSRASAMHRARLGGASLPAAFVLQFMNPGAPGRFPKTSLALYFIAADGASFAELLARGGPLGAVLRRFLELRDNEERSERGKMLKLIPSLAPSSPALIRAVVPARVPCLIGTCVRTATYCMPEGAPPEETQYVEVDVDVGSAAIADRFFRHLFHRLAGRVVLDLALLLEGSREEELPEQLLGVAHSANVGPALAVPLPVAQARGAHT